MTPIDLDRHAVIDASAGTGKTHTIEDLVIRLVGERRVPLEQILVVTFTEKATGELRGRLRDRLQKCVVERGPGTELHRAALDSFDQAAIHTIHGFCQRLLNEYAFENGQEFRGQLVNDRELLRSCLREIQRREWPTKYGELLPLILEMEGFVDDKGATEWENSLLELACKLRPESGHRLLPECDDNWMEGLRTAEASMGPIAKEIGKLAGPVDSTCPERHLWSKLFQRSPLGPRLAIARHRDVLLPMLGWLADIQAGRSPLASYYRLLRRCPGTESFAEKGFLQLTVNASKETHAFFLEECPPFARAVEMIEELRQAGHGGIGRYQLTIHTLGRLHKYLRDCKRQRGQFSYDDLLSRVADTLDSSKNPAADAVCALLRQRYRYAIVDEFQDTDPLQWRIFRTLFVDGADSNRLFLVGDPKQAIYGFRGADLPTYLAATKELAEHAQAARETLLTNWRSSPEMLKALNHLFAHSGWFSEYKAVASAPPREGGNELVQDTSGRPAMTIIDLADVAPPVTAPRNYARFVVGEIQGLLGSGMKVKIKGRIRPLQASDIAVLVFKRKDAAPLLRELDRLKIAYTFYKQPGLWDSDEAVHLTYLLRALANPDDRAARSRALMTRFFRLEAAELAVADDLGAEQEIRDRLHMLAHRAERRNWAGLFQALLEDLGTAYYERDFHDAERRLANYRHIFGVLEQAAYGRCLDLVGLLDLLENTRLGDAAAADDDYQPIETERHKVQILTIHAGKGLEFPVVFLAGGFSGNPTNGLTAYREQDSQRMIYDLAPPSGAVKELMQQEAKDSWQRLLYVALTRAMFKLYVPVAPEPENGKGGPLYQCLRPALEAAQLEQLGPTSAETIAPDDVPHTNKMGRAVKASASPVSELKKLTADLFPSLDTRLANRRVLVRSFTSLHREHPVAQPEATTFGESEKRTDDDAPDALSGGDDDLRGPVFGDLVHRVLERVDFEEVGRAKGFDELLRQGTPFSKLLDEEVPRDLPNLWAPATEVPLEVRCRMELARLVFNALHTPLEAAAGKLWQIPERDRLAELRFHFPEHWTGPLPEGIEQEGNFLTGSMDLVFRRDEEYFLLDWKTNVLPGGYSAEAVKHSARDCDYVRQYRIYLHALARWLGQRKGFNQAQSLAAFGGVYYLYLRGLNGKDESAGVYFHRPEAADLDLEKVLHG